MQRVEWLRDRIRDGWRIGEAARVIDEATSVALDEPRELRDTLIAAIEENDPPAVSATLDQAFAVLPLEQALPRSWRPRSAGPGTRGTAASSRSRRSMRSRPRCARISAG